MIAIAFLFVCVLCDCSKSRRRLEAEILVLLSCSSAQPPVAGEVTASRREPPRGLCHFFEWSAQRKTGSIDQILPQA